MKRPQVNLPKLQVPGFLGDLYYDLRDRRLLPLVALVVVAIAATPILLSQSSEAPPPAGGAIAALGEGGEPTSKLTVVEAQPGLRDYRKRLRGRKPTDPFRKSAPKQSLAGAQLGGGEGEGGASSGSPRSTSTTVRETSTTKTTTESTTGGSTGGGGGSAPGQGAGIVHYTYAIDVSVVHSTGSEAEGNKQSDPPESRKRVLPPSPVPDEQHQVLGYLGVNPKTHRALFLVSSEVTGTFGEGHCAFGGGTCQLIELEPGFPEVFELGPTDRYSIKVTKVEPVALGPA